MKNINKTIRKPLTKPFATPLKNIQKQLGNNYKKQ